MKNKKVKLPVIKKDIKDFLLNEEGKISKKDILKIGTGLLTLSAIFMPEKVMAGHTNFFYPATVNNGVCADLSGNGGHCSHNSHSSHGSHCSGGVDKI